MNKANIISTIQNKFGILIHYLHGGDINSIDSIFSDNIVLKLPVLGAQYCGKTEVVDYFKKYQIEDKQFLLLQSPAFSVADNMHHAEAMFEANTITLFPEESSFEHGSCRFDVKFVLCNKDWLISEISWYFMMNFVPQTDTKENLLSALSNSEYLPPLSASASASDLLSLQNIMGIICHNNRVNAIDLFVKDENSLYYNPYLSNEMQKGYDQIDRFLKDIDKREKENSGYFLHIPFLSAPVIDVDGDNAKGWWLAQCFEFEKPDETLDAHMIRLICRYYVEFKRVDDKWLIQSILISPFYSLPAEIMDHKKPGQSVLTADDNKWTYLIDTNSFADQYPYDALMLQSLLPEWTTRLRRGEMHEYLDYYFDQDNPEITLHIRINPQVGRELIEKRINEYDHAFIHLQPTSHNGSTPFCWINENGDEARINYLDQSWTNINGAMGKNFFPVPYFRTSGNYCFYYTKKLGEWQLTKIQWMPICLLQDLIFNPDTTKGWAATGSKNLWPLPFEEMVISK